MADDPDHFPYNPQSQNLTVFKVQVVFCTILGLFIFFFFCMLRFKFPLVYGIRPYRNQLIRKLPNSLFGWCYVLHKIKDNEVLQISGLDSFVFLRFFKVGIKILLTLSVFSLLIISPFRYLIEGYLSDTSLIHVISDEDDKPKHKGFMFVYSLFTYVFTGIVLYFMFDESELIIKERQRYLASQSLVTDKTIRITNIPQRLLSEFALKDYIEKLGLGSVTQVSIVYDYSQLNKLFERRKSIVQKLERAYSSKFGLRRRIYSKDNVPSTVLNTSYSLLELENTQEPEAVPNSNGLFSRIFANSGTLKRLRPFGTKVDPIFYYSTELQGVDKEIEQLRFSANFQPINAAFVTLSSVEEAQLAAQAIISPKIFQMTTCLAPSPNDVNWDNFLINAKTKLIRKNAIELTVILVSALLVVPTRYITSLLKLSAIKKMWPTFGHYLESHKWVMTVVTGILPTYLFTIINVILPYFIYYITQYQGMISKGDIELSVIKKNFLYVFFNLFLIFTVFGTLSSYWSLLSDTTRIAYLLATSIKEMSVFYVNLILLQGLTMFPFKLLQVGDMFFLFWQYVMCYRLQTPRNYRDLFYKPAVFDFGLILPQHIFIFIITLIYSVISTQIVTSGLCYFILGYYTYKYQLTYSMVHLPHSTGKAWKIIFNRVVLGLFFFQLTMIGTLALESRYILAGLLIPLLAITAALQYVFNKYYAPLTTYIALESITNPPPPSEPDSSSHSPVLTPEILGEEEPLLRVPLRKRKSTIEEERELEQKYVYPLIKEPLDGPWIGFNGDFIEYIQYETDGTTLIPTVKVKKHTRVEYD
ncbi:Calcium permeable stress-gated cation channel 1 [Komagataella phaffii]